jgi:N-acetylated-alpha-linked acidic dipeptidase
MRFGDPGFKYGVALAEITGHAMIQLAGMDILPLRFKDFADEISQYIKDISKITDDMRENTVKKNRIINENIYLEYSDPTKIFISPKPDELVPFLNFAPLQNSLAKVQLSSDNYSSVLISFREKGKSLSAEKEKILNDILMITERSLTSKDGLPKRPWYRHQIYAPGLYTGYGVKTLPGVREAIEQRNWDEAAIQIEKIAKVLQDYTAEIDKACDILRGQ